MPSSPRPPFVWKLWGTSLWSLALLAVMSIVGLIVVAALATYEGVPLRGDAAELAARFNPAVLASLESIGLIGPMLATIWLAVRRAGQNFPDYLALRLPSRGHALVGVAAVVTLLLATDGIAHLMNWPVTSTGLIAGLARNPRWEMVPLMATSLVATTPITEEAVFRGFIYRGFAASRLGPVGAVLLSSVMFTALHVQYDAVGLGEVLASGLLLGAMRWLSGSTLLTIVMHSFVNAVALIEAVWAAGLMR